MRLLEDAPTPNTQSVGGLRDLAPNGETSRTSRWWFALLPLLLLLAFWLAHDDEPDSLSEVSLVGARSPVPVSMVILLDESGSFSNYAQVRQQVLDQLATWAPANLRGDDLITVAAFASEGTLKAPTMTVNELAQNPAPYSAVQAQGDSTEIQPALDLISTTTTAANAPVSLVFITDTEATDLNPTELDPTLRDLGASTLSVITPTGIDVNRNWTNALGWGPVFTADPNDADQIALAVGQSFAHATGQNLEDSDT